MGDDHQPASSGLKGSANRLALTSARAAAVQEYLKHRGEPGLAVRLAGKLGMATSGFYELVRKWRSTGTHEALAPYHQKGLRRSQMADDTAAELGRLLATIGSDPGQDRPSSDEQIVRRVLDAWPSTVPAPAPATVRRHIARELRPAGRLRTGETGLPGVGRADAPGELLMVDHTALKVVTDVKDGERTIPLLSMVVDMFQGAVLGCSLDTGHVDANRARAAIASAGAVAEDARPEHLPLHVRPTIQLQTEYGQNWTTLIADMVDAGAHVSHRRTQKLAFGGRVHKILGGRLGPFELVPRAAHRTPDRRIEGRLAETAEYVPFDELEVIVRRVVAEQRTRAFSTAAVAEPGAGPEPAPGVLETWRRLAALARDEA